jgi:nucleoside-diphosphate-sugar epimerase
MKKILITGGMGFIGKFLVRKLLAERDYEITIVDNLSSSKVDELLTSNPRVTFINASFENWMPPASVKYDQIYHLTSPVGPLGVLKYKGRIAEMILKQLYHATEFAMKMDSKLLEISTSEVYGQHPDNEEEGQREDIDKIVPANLTVRLEYGVAKLLCEIVLKNLSRDNKLDYICIRPFNIVGPKQNGDLGFIIPRFLRQAKAGEPLTVYGNGSQKRTFTHVQDFVDAIFLTLESNRTGETYNVGHPGNVSTILNLAEKIKLVTKTSSPISFVDPTTMYKDFAEAWNKIPNIDKIREHTGWQPKYSLDFIVDEVAKMGDAYLIK